MCCYCSCCDVKVQSSEFRSERSKIHFPYILFVYNASNHVGAWCPRIGAQFHSCGWLRKLFFICIIGEIRKPSLLLLHHKARSCKKLTYFTREAGNYMELLPGAKERNHRKTQRRQRTLYRGTSSRRHTVDLSERDPNHYFHKYRS